eukprot:TRINITY_DN3184_c0_g2_i2.p1 TRINITY_DN3184_c0_g2~~TRINITY_DN3184_c0_g2_i2.p1  ORF type:complete len:108 (-),score=0.67 TRINITY_DN3184_c0_g2_i2:111-434(-)
MNLTILLMEFTKKSVRLGKLRGTNMNQIKRAGLVITAANCFKWVGGVSFISFLPSEIKPSFPTVPHEGDTDKMKVNLRCLCVCRQLLRHLAMRINHLKLATSRDLHY